MYYDEKTPILSFGFSGYHAADPNPAEFVSRGFVAGVLEATDYKIQAAHVPVGVGPAAVVRAAATAHVELGRLGIVAFGAGKHDAIYVESQARNVFGNELIDPDLPEEWVWEGNPWLGSFDAMVERLYPWTGIPTVLSKNAGSYYCNYLMSLLYSNSSITQSCTFIHVPSNWSRTFSEFVGKRIAHAFAPDFEDVNELKP